MKVRLLLTLSEKIKALKNEEKQRKTKHFNIKLNFTVKTNKFDLV